MERVGPRVFRHVALPAPTEREKSQMHAQRYVCHLPAAGEVVLFDRSWYNRVLVEHVMGFCRTFEYEEFLRLCPSFEVLLRNNGIILVKYWFEVSEEVSFSGQSLGNTAARRDPSRLPDTHAALPRSA